MILPREDVAHGQSCLGREHRKQDHLRSDLIWPQVGAGGICAPGHDPLGDCQCATLSVSTVVSVTPGPLCCTARIE